MSYSCTKLHVVHTMDKETTYCCVTSPYVYVRTHRVETYAIFMARFDLQLQQDVQLHRAGRFKFVVGGCVNVAAIRTSSYYSRG